ncbi:MAG: 50S ribosomal protein L10 [Verrucomicrobia bacterium]|nr:50S ribosomal protein L10 [Verrucomicrobiota bacterium]
MRAEKKLITAEYVTRLNASPFFIVVDYTGLTVAQFSELRGRLRGNGSEVHVVKNSIFQVAAKEAGLADLAGSIAGQLAVVTGQRDVSAAAKTVKTFQSEFEKPKIKFGYLKDQRLEADAIKAIADLPSLDVLRSKLLGLMKAPQSKLVALINTPGSQLARVIKAKAEKPA